MITTDLDNYSKQYGRFGRIFRLQFIAEHARADSQKQLRADVLRLLTEACKETLQTKLYQESFAQLRELSMQNVTVQLPSIDHAWLDSASKTSASKLEALESDLHQAKVTQIKENIRQAHMHLVEYYFSKGDPQNALKNLIKCREYCVDPSDALKAWFQSMAACFFTHQYNDLLACAGKVQHSPYRSEADNAKVQVAQGLYQLRNGKFKEAANAFIAIKASELGASFHDVIAVQDVAVYGSLCALASLTRQELTSKFDENSSFRESLDFAPQIRDVALDFCHCNFSRCLQQLEKLKESFDLDVFLHPVVRDLLLLIRDKAICHYFSPFLSVSLASMAKALNVQDANGLETEVSRLISKKMMPAKIDAHSKVLYRRTANVQRSAFTDALKMGNAFLENTQALMLKMNLAKYDIAIKPQKKGPAIQ